MKTVLRFTIIVVTFRSSFLRVHQLMLYNFARYKNGMNTIILTLNKRIISISFLSQLKGIGRADDY